MATTHNLALSWSGGGQSFTSTAAYTGTGEHNVVSESIANGTDQLINWTCDFSALQSLYIVCDKEVTLFTNVVDPGTDSIVLKANLPYIWYTGPSYYSLFIGTDVTKLYFTNAGTTATFNLYSLTDATP